MNRVIKLVLAIFIMFSIKINALEYNYDSKYTSQDLRIIKYEYVEKDLKPFVRLSDHDSGLYASVCRACSQFNIFGFVIPADKIDDISSWQDETIHYSVKRKSVSFFRGKQVKLYLIDAVEKLENKELRDLNFIYTREFGIIAYQSFEMYKGKEIVDNYYLMSKHGLGAILKK